MRFFKLPRLHFGFPIAANDDSSEPSREKRRGVALIVAIVIIAIMVVLASDLIVSSQVNLEIGVSHRDNLKAEYMAKSGANLAVFLLTIDWAVDLFLASDQSPMKMAPSDSLGDIWNVMNGIPIGGDSAMLVAAMQDQFKLNKVLDENILNQLKLFDGNFVLNVTDETSKINVNYCGRGRCVDVMLMLEGLFSCPAEKSFMEAKKVNPKELAYKIKDWIHFETKASPESGVSDKNEPYRDKQPPYKPKSAPIDSIDELRMVDGMDDEIFTVFSPYITAFPIQAADTDKAKININTAARELLGCLIPESRSACGQKFALAMKTRNEDKGSLTEGADVASVLQDLLCYNKGGPQQGQEASDDKTKWFSQSSNVFRVSIKGTVGNQEKTVDMIIERSIPDTKEKIDQSYRILFWKMT